MQQVLKLKSIFLFTRGRYRNRATRKIVFFLTVGNTLNESRFHSSDKSVRAHNLNMMYRTWGAKSEENT